MSKLITALLLSAAAAEAPAEKKAHKHKKAKKAKKHKKAKKAE